MKMTIPEVLVSLHATAHTRAQVFGPSDSSVVTALAMCDAIETLWYAAQSGDPVHIKLVVDNLT